MIRLARFLLAFTSLLTCDWETERIELDRAIDGWKPAADAKVCGVRTDIYNPHWLRLQERPTPWWTRVGGEAEYNWELRRWEIKTIEYRK